MSLLFLICWNSNPPSASLFNRKAIKKETCIEALFCRRSIQREPRRAPASTVLATMTVLLFPASEKCSTNRNHFLLEAYKEVHKSIPPHISKQITTTSLSRESGAQVSIFQSPFRKDDLITATLLPKNYLLPPVSSSKGTSTEPPHWDISTSNYCGVITCHN